MPIVSFFFKNGQPRDLYYLFSVFSTIQFLQKINANNVMYMQYTEPGFEPMSFGTRVSSHNH